MKAINRALKVILIIYICNIARMRELLLYMHLNYVRDPSILFEVIVALLDALLNL